jgi:hypothetical protein
MRIIANMRARRDSAIAPEKMEGNSAFQTDPKVQGSYANSRLALTASSTRRWCQKTNDLRVRLLESRSTGHLK